MKIKHDPQAGHFTLYMNDKKNTGSKMIAPNCIVDFDADGNVIAIEILDAPKNEIDPAQVEYIDITTPAYRAAQDQRLAERKAAREAEKDNHPPH